MLPIAGIGRKPILLIGFSILPVRIAPLYAFGQFGLAYRRTAARCE
jgi:hypothetical protein